MNRAERWAAWTIAALWYGVALPLGGAALFLFWVLVVAVPVWARVAWVEMRMIRKRWMR